MNAKTTQLLPALAVLAAGALLAAPALAQEGDADAGDGGTFEGEVRVGYRSVDVSGDTTKYAEDVDLDDGPRLFDLTLDLVPGSGIRPLVDRIRLDMSNYGGDPFETLSLDVVKRGTFDFRYDRRTSEYFYEDLILPHDQASIPLSNVGDLHHFDFERVQDSADLDVDLGARAGLTFGFDRFTKRGEGTTTLDLSRDEFELDRIIDESLDAWHVGFEYRWDAVTLVVEERVRDYENLFEEFLPGASLGENPNPNASLDFFFLEQPYDFRSNEHVVRAIARPTDRWTVRAVASLERLDLDLEADERSQGTLFNGQPFETDVQGSGEIERDGERLDVDVSYLVTDRVSLTGGVYRRAYDQEGDFTFGALRNLGAWDVETTGAEAGVQLALSPAVTLAGGARWEERDVEHDAIEGADPGDRLSLSGDDTGHTGFFGSVAWRPADLPLRLTAEVDSSSYDDPFTLSSPTDRLRTRVRASWGLGAGLTLTGSYVGHESDNDDSGWDASADQVNLALGWRRDGLDLSLGYGLVAIDRRIDQLVSTGTLFPIDYSLESDFLDGRVRWQAAERWALGGSFLLYENDGSFPIERDDLRAFVEHLWMDGYTARLGFRTVDFDEDAFGFESYDADIVELSLGYRW